MHLRRPIHVVEVWCDAFGAFDAVVREVAICTVVAAGVGLFNVVFDAGATGAV